MRRASDLAGSAFLIECPPQGMFKKRNMVKAWRCSVSGFKVPFSRTEVGVLTSDVPMNFLVPLMPPVSRRPWGLIPWSHAASTQSWIWKIDGSSPLK